jgi:hypothetical protein
LLVEALRKEGLDVRLLWEVAGPHGSAWLTCYLVRTDGGLLRSVMVQTFDRDNGWEAWVPTYEGIEADKTVQAVLRHCRPEAR